MKNFIEPAIKFFKNINGNLAIAFGHDCDSIASASIIYKLTKKLKLKPKLVVSLHNFEIDEKTEKSLKNFENIVIVDIGDTPEERINKIASFKNLLIIDHHIPKNYNCYYVNPRLYNKNVYMPTSYIAWLIYKEFFDDNEILWIASFGTLGDFGAKNNKDLFKLLKKKNPELIGDCKIEDRELFEKSLTGKIAKMVDSCRIFEGIEGVKYVTNLIARSKSYEELLKDKKINQIYQKLERAFKNELKKLEKRKIEIGEFLVYEIKSKLNLKSSLASYLPKVFPNKIIFVAQKSEEGYYEVSVRRGINRKVNLAKLVEEISRNIKAKGGGHPTAAGMRVDDLKELIEFLKNKKRKSRLLC
jgi:single-stranded DNA-specific DHH superfamily exonuclease